MGLGTHQEQFAYALGQLLVWAYEHQLPVRGGEWMRTPDAAALNAKQGDGISTSLHIDKLAVDLNRVINGVLSNDPKDYKPLADYWKTLHPDARWGGDFKPTVARPYGDIYHFSLTYGGRK